MPVRDYSRMAARGRVSAGEEQWLKALGTLNEFQARLFVAQRALELGRGGVSRLARLTGMSRPTIRKGAAELRGRARLRPAAAGRIRQAGGGRRKVEEASPRLRRELLRLEGPAVGQLRGRRVPDRQHAHAERLEGQSRPRYARL